MFNNARGRGWDTVPHECQQFFLLIYPTVPNSRPVLEMGEDYEGSFVGSLLYLLIEKDIPASVLGREQCMGYLEPSAVEIILQERKRFQEAERVAREEQVPEGGWCRNDKWGQRNLAGGGGHSDSRLIREGPLGPNSQGHPSLPLHPEFSNSSNPRSIGRRNGARSGYPARGVGTPAIFPHALCRIEAQVTQDL